MEVKNLLPSLHPLFRVSYTQIFWIGTVQKVNNKGVGKPRILVIATPGLFEIEKHTFPQKYVISSKIPFRDLVLIRNDGNQMSFYAPGITMIYTHPEHIKITSIVINAREMIFGNQPREPKISIPPEIMNSIKQFNYTFMLDYPLSDKFLSLCLKIPSESLIPDQISDYYDQLSQNSNEEASFGPELVASSLFAPIAEAVAFDHTISSILFKNLEFSLIIPSFESIIKYNKSITTVTFFAVSFQNVSIEFKNLFKNLNFMGSSFIFEDCPLDSQGFRIFFESLAHLPNPITSLTFQQCLFDPDSIENVFQTILVSPCFKSLKSLQFIGVHSSIVNSFKMNIMRFLSSEFLLSNKPLKELTIDSCNQTLDFIIQLLTSLETGIVSAIFPGNSLMTSLSIQNFQQLGELSLSRCHFSASSLLSLLRCFEVARQAPSVLILDNLQIDDDQWTLFFEDIDTITMPSLAALSFAQNRMIPQHFIKFARFIEINQPHLIDLNISSSIVPEDSKECIQSFSQIVGRFNSLKRLVLAAKDESTVLKQDLIPLLRALRECSTIRKLDISNQCVGIEGLNEVVELANNQLDGLLFDGNCPQSPDSYLNCLDRICNSNLKTAVWPVNDVAYLTTKVPISKKSMFLQEIDVLRTKFSKRLEKEKYGSGLPRLVRKESIRVMDEKEVSYNFREQKIIDLLCECFNCNSNQLKEPLSDFIEEFTNVTSVDTYFKSFSQ